MAPAWTGIRTGGRRRPQCCLSGVGRHRAAGGNRSHPDVPQLFPRKGSRKVRRARREIRVGTGSQSRVTRASDCYMESSREHTGFTRYRPRSLPVLNISWKTKTYRRAVSWEESHSESKTTTTWSISMKPRVIGLTLALLLVISLPAFAQKVTVDYDKAASFTNFKTYAWKEGTPAKNPLMQTR